MRVLSRLCCLAVALLTSLGGLRAQSGTNQPGLLARATDGERTAVFITPTANFTLAADESIHPQLKPAFQIEWNGFLSVLRAGEYTFHANARVLIDGQEAQGKTVQLQSGDRPVRIEFKRQAGAARLQLEWQSASFHREPVPASLLNHRDAPAELAATQKSERGRRLVEDLNCVACHKAGTGVARGRTGPDLSAVGDRANAAWIFAWLENPRHFRKDAAMPALLIGAQDRADVAAYLATLKSKAQATPIKTDAARAAKGAELLTSLGCAACHDDKRASLAGLGSKYPASELARFLIDPLAVDPCGRMPEMALSHGEAEALALHLVQSKNADFEKAPPAGNAAHGRELVASSGCANCHTLRDDRGALASTLTAPAFDKLAADKGCLADAPSAKSARYDLAAADREALAAFVKQPDRSAAPVQEFHRVVSQLNCNACHELNQPAQLSFAVSQAPPPLTDSGNKLRSSWLSGVLLHHKRVRPWMNVRMPHFGEGARPLVDVFAAQAGAEPGEGAMIPLPTKEQIEAGVKLLGTADGGLACVNCHDFRGQKSLGELRGPDLMEMYPRVRADWIRRWLWEPSRLQPGTAMPAFFTGMPEAKAAAMIEQIIQALAAGKDMPNPPGWSELGPTFTLTVTDSPIVFRTSIYNSHPRSIAVGLPGGQSYCFDAQFCFLRFAWSGGFLDVKPLWGTRGGEPALPLGTVWYNTQSAYPLHFGNPDAQPQAHFRGYKLEKKLPVFLYDVDGVSVREKITSSSDGKGLVREFELGPTKADLWFIVPELPRVKFTSSAGAFVNGRLKIPAGDSLKFTVTLQPQ